MLKNIDLFTSYLPSLAHMEARTGWEGWPFSGFGTLTFWGLLAKALFVTAIFVGLAYLMRYLFGPGGKLRGDDWETIEEARARREAEQEGAGKPGQDEKGAKEKKPGAKKL